MRKGNEKEESSRKDATPLDSQADLVINGKIGEVLGEACSL